MTHEFSLSFKDAARIRERRAPEEANIDMGFEDIDVAEGSILDACNRAAVVDEFTDIGSAGSEPGKPMAGRISKEGRSCIEPKLDGGIVRQGSIVTEDFVQALTT